MNTKVDYHRFLQHTSGRFSGCVHVPEFPDFGYADLYDVSMFGTCQKGKLFSTHPYAVTSIKGRLLAVQFSTTNAYKGQEDKVIDSGRGDGKKSHISGIYGFSLVPRPLSLDSSVLSERETVDSICLRPVTDPQTIECLTKFVWR